jgi:Mg-chelatase subunit ChlD
MMYWSVVQPYASQVKNSTIRELHGKVFFLLKRILKFGMMVNALVLLSAANSPAQSTSGSLNSNSSHGASALSPMSAPALVQCAPVSQIPCFSATVTPSDRTGKPVPAGLPSKDRLLQAIQIQSDGTTIAPFYVSSGSDSSQRPNVVLIEVDISGSMNSPVSPGVSRFDAAQSAITKYLENMQENVDQIAIVPFESHNVVSTIQSAVFTSKRSEAMAQLKALPRPGTKNNTALFQAVYSGVQTMQTEITALVKPGTTTSDFQPRVIVMTDGKNEVMRGDDPDLLDGPLGMQQAVAKVAASSGLDVIGIGFGDPTGIDTDALKRLSKRIFLATTGDELAQIFRDTTPLKTSNLQVTFLSPWSDRPSLTSRDPQFEFTLTLPDGRRLTSPPMRYTTPAMGTPLYERQASGEEMQALIATRPAANSGWDTVLRSLLVFVGCGVLLLLLWFWIPRLIWGNQYAGNLAAVSANRRWGKDAGVKASGVQMRTVANAPDGFDADLVRAKQQRSPGQITQVQPRGEISKTRING